MKRRFWKGMAALAVCFALAGCDEDVDSVGDDGAETSTAKEATFLLYMVGQNDLSSFLNENIKDLMTGYGNSDIQANVLVYADISSAPELYLIDKDQQGTVQKTTVKTYPDQYSVDPEVMKAVITEVFGQYPASRRGIVFSSHADGSLFTPNTVSALSFGYEGSKGYGMNVTDIREALDGGPYFDLLMFDACMMASVETAYELRDKGRFFLAAPNSVPGEGFPYDQVLPSLLKMDAAGVAEAGQMYMDYFRNNDASWDDFVAVSVSDLAQLDSLAVYMDSLFQSTAVQQRPEAINRSLLQSFESGYALYDYGEWVDSLGLDNPYVAEVRERLDRVVIYKDHGDYASVNDYTERLEIPVRDEAFCGLNTYVPLQDPSYAELSQMEFFTTLQWYRDAGFWRSAFYSRFE